MPCIRPCSKELTCAAIARCPLFQEGIHDSLGGFDHVHDGCCFFLNEFKIVAARAATFTATRVVNPLSSLQINHSQKSVFIRTSHHNLSYSGVNHFRFINERHESQGHHRSYHSITLETRGRLKEKNLGLFLHFETCVKNIK